MNTAKLAYEKLFSPGKLGAMEVKNRIVMAPMGTRLASEIGGVTCQQIQYYVERAKGGGGHNYYGSGMRRLPVGAHGTYKPVHSRQCAHSWAQRAGRSRPFLWG